MKILASTKLRNGIFGPLFLSAAIALAALTPVRIQAQQLPEVNILTAVGNMASRRSGWPSNLNISKRKACAPK